jgi:glycerate kinase
MTELAPVADLEGAGSAGGLGAALAALGGKLVPGSELVLDLVGFRERLRDVELVVTGEGIVDRWSDVRGGKSSGAVASRCVEAGVPCVVFGGQILHPVEGAELYELSGDTDLAAEDLVALGELLGRKLR